MTDDAITCKNDQSLNYLIDFNRLIDNISSRPSLASEKFYGAETARLI